MLILEVREIKRLSKKIKTEYFELKPGNFWFTGINGERINIQANASNTQTLYCGKRK